MTDNDDVSTSSGHDGPVLTPNLDPVSGEAEPVAARSVGRSLRSRLAGLIAVVLGIVGVLASLVVAFLVIRGGFGATSTVESLLDPVANTLDRVETRIDQADDAVDRDGVAPELMPELRARSEGLFDVASSGRDLYGAVSDHAIYRWLPVDLDPLASSVEEFARGATSIEEVVASTGDGRALSGANASIVADELDTLQAGVAPAGDALDGATRSLKRWIRIGAFFGFLGAFWSAWAQFCLVRRGLRGLSGRAL